MKSLGAGRYRIISNLPGENWYLRAITQPVPGQAKGRVDISRTGITVKRSEKLSGIEIVLTEGAASISGRIVYPTDLQTKTKNIPLSRYRVHLIPAESAAAENILRYAEVPADSNGSFAFKNLAPGKYWILTRPMPESDSVEIPSRPIAWDAVERAKLRREAETLKNVIDLQSCQRVKNFDLRI
jgi:hypothetical protein